MKVSRRSLLAASLALPPGLALADTAAKASWPDALVMATGRPGGSYDVYGPAWGRLALQTCGVTIAYRASGGAASNILLIEQDAAQLGMTTATVADQAWGGAGSWTAGVKLTNFRALFPAFPSILQVVTPGNSGITAISGLAGQVIGIGPDGGSGSAAVSGILAKLGIFPARTVTGDYAPQIMQMQPGGIAACAFIGAPPLPAIFFMAQRHTLRLIGLTIAEAALISKAMPGMTRMLIPATTFPRQAAPVGSVGTANFTIGAASLPDSLVQALTLAAMRNQTSLARAVPAAATPAQNLLGAPEDMLFHRGAATALRSLGLNLPARSVEG